MKIRVSLCVIPAFGNASIKVHEDVIINPMIYYSRQANASETVGGLYAPV